jgi:hypothetical protein
MKITTLLGGAALIGAAATANAAVTGGAITGGSSSPGTFSILAPPFEVGDDNQQENNALFAFNEQPNVLLAAPLTLDLGGTLAAGTRVASHGIVYDPAASKSVIGSVTFDRKVLGILWLTSKLQATDALFGLPTITYNSPSARGLETVERGSTSFAGNTVFLSWTASSPGDNIRVLTAVPEAGTWAMLIAGFGMIGMAARRRKVAATA